MMKNGKVKLGSELDKLGVEVWVIGAGVVGLAMARYLSDAGLKVGVVESSEQGEETSASELNRGFTTGDQHTDPYETRKRGLLGTVNLWNIETPYKQRVGRFVFPEESDMDGSVLGNPCWPLTMKELEPFLRGAEQELDIDDLPLVPPKGEEQIRRADYRMQSYDFLIKRANEDEKNGTIHFLRGVSVLEIQMSESGDAVRGLRCCSLKGSEEQVLSAEAYILATGVIENARLLLSSKGGTEVAVGNHSGHLGRHYMDHTIDNTVYVEFPQGYETKKLKRFDTFEKEGVLCLGYEKFSCDYRRKHQLLNFAYTLTPVPWWIHSDEIAAVKGGIRGKLGKFSFKSIVKGSCAALCLLKHRFVGTKLYGTKLFGWSCETNWQRQRRYVLAIVAEQHSSDENYITLSDQLDVLGQKKVQVNWRWTEQDSQSLDKNKAHIVSELEKEGAKVTIRSCDGKPSGSHHHFGTTRMSHESKDGVVGVDGRIFGVSNLYVGGASLCPTSSFVNPTFIGVTLGLYVANQLIEHRNEA